MPAPSAFTGPIPQTYHRFLGPLLFEPYAQDLLRRVTGLLGARDPQKPLRLLELACGTGIVTRVLRNALPRTASFVATDLNPAMLDVARTHAPPDAMLTYQAADACSLPFDDASFDLVICQYGVMFFPDKPRAMREARRVLAPGGHYLFSVWDSLEHNPIPRVVHEKAAARFPDNPPKFLLTPYGSYDRAPLEAAVHAGGFSNVTCEVVTLPSEAPTAEAAARGFIEGTPLRLELADRGVTDATEIVQAAATDLGARFGVAPCKSTMRALIFDVS